MSISVFNLVLFFMWLTAGAILVSALSSFFYKKVLWFYFCLILSMSFLANSLIGFFIAFELSLVPIILMILYWGSQPERVYSSFFLLIYTSLFSIPFIFVMILVKKSFFIKNSLTCSFFISILLMAPFLVKMPVLGIHFWLPKAHVEASTTGSMVLAGVLLKLGSYGLLRILSFVVAVSLKYFSTFLMVLSIISGMMTFMQSDMKKIVAYSSVSHMTFMLMSSINLSYLTIFIFIVLSLIHGWVSMGMFLFAGTLSSVSFSRLTVLMKSESKFHWFVLVCGVLLVGNVGLPPFPSFFCEVYLICFFLTSNFLYFFILLLGVCFCYYNLYLFMILSHSTSYESKMSSIKLKNFFNLYSLMILIILTNFLIFNF